MAVDLGKQKPKLHRQLAMAGPWPMAVAFLADGKLAAGDQDGRILIWDMAAAPSSPVAGSKSQSAPSSTPIRMLVGHTNGVSRLCASPDGRRLYSASLDHSIRVWNLDSATTGEAETIVEPQSEQDKKAKKPEPTVKVPTQEADKVLAGHGDWVSALALSADGKRLISGDYGARVIVWDAATGAEVVRWSGLPWNWIFAVALTSDGGTALVSESRYKRDDFDVPAAAVRLWDATTGKEKLDLLKVQFPKYDPQAASYEASQTWRKYVSHGIIAAAFSPDDKTVALAVAGENDKGTAHLHDVATGKLLRDLGSHQYGMTDVAFSADGRYVLTTGRDTCLRVTNVADGKEALQLGAPRGGQFKDWFSACARSADERYLAAADIAGWVQVWATDAK